MASAPKVPSWGPYEDWQGWLRGLVISLLGGAFFASAGAFGSSQVALPARFAYWLGLMLIGWLWGLFVYSALFGRKGRPQNVWLRIAASSLAISIPYSVVVGLASKLAWGSRFTGVGDVLYLVGGVTAVTALSMTLNVFVAHQAGGATSASSQPARFLDRLPLKLRGAEVWAVEAEDHYLRLHTSKGQDLILMRLSDAIDELEGIEGARAHRSWWVARDAITEAERGDGRATLTLKDGSQVPVSRTYARLLRERGWF